MMRRSMRNVAVGWVVFCLVPGILVAGGFPDGEAVTQEDRSLAERSAVILTGEVLALGTTQVGSLGVDEALVAVERVVHGQLLSSPVTLRFPSVGKPLGAGPAAHDVRVSPLGVSGGDRVLLFLERGRAGLEVLGGGAGAFRLQQTEFGEVAISGQGVEGSAELLTVRDAGSFLDWLSAVSTGAEPAVDYWRQVPAGALRLETSAEPGGTVSTIVEKAQPVASASDPAGDAGANAIVFPSPDLRSIQASVSGTTLTFDVRYHDGTFFPVETSAEITLDTDQDPSTGSPGIDSNDNDADLIGGDYLVVIEDGEVRIRRFDGCCFTLIATVASSRLSNGFRTSFPLSLLGDDDGLFNFKATTSTYRDNSFSPILDYIPDLGKPPAIMVGEPAVIPEAPSGLDAREITQGTVDLDWMDNAANETGFEIERRIGGGSFQQIATVGANVSSYQDTAVEPATSYSYRVRASNAAGVSGYSNVASTTTAVATAPSELTAEALSDSEIQLGWTDNSLDETGFEIEMRSGTDEFGLVQSLPAGTTATTITGLDEATAYTFRVRATTPGEPTPYSNEATATTFLSDTTTCIAGPTTRCLGGGRFQVEIEWRDFAGGTGAGSDTGLQSGDSALFYFFDPDNWEMLVKVLDGCDLTGHFWVFAAATTDVEYTLTVTDTVSGFVRTYENALGTASPAITDTAAFATCSAGESSTASATASTTVPAVELALEPAVGMPPQGVIGEQGTCTPDATRQCLNQGRFQVEVEWVTGEDQGFGQVDAFGSADSGLFWFFSPNNLEMLVKVLDGCAFNDRVWVFSAATTDVEYVLRVVDTVTGVEKLYPNTAGNAAAAVTDTAAFDSCS